MQIVILAAFIVALTLADLAPVVAGNWLVAPALAMYLAGAAGIGALRTALSLRAMARRPDCLPGAFRRYRLMTLAAHGWLVAGLAGVVSLGYGRWALDDLRLGYVPLAGEVVLLCPFAAALVLSWLLEYPLYRRTRERIAHHQLLAGLPARPGWSLAEFLGYNLRHHLLFVAVPVGLILLLTDSLHLLHPYWPSRWADAVTVGGSLACAGGVFLCAPLLIVRIWQTERLPPGPLRQGLMDLCRQMRLSCRDLLIWRSGGMIANAGVMGLIGRVRYVLLTDALLEHMDEREVRSIFAHEAGHIVGHHLFYAMLFAVSSVTLCSAGGELLAWAGALPWWAGQAITLAALLATWAAGFGWISRRFERQSDVTAAQLGAPGGPDPDGRIPPEGAAIFARSLEHVAQLNGMAPTQWNWRHGSIAWRVEYVLWLGSTAGTRRQIDRTVRRIKLGLWLATTVSGVVLAVRLALGV
ncbi:MAG TPA: M48 family metallopeptidase [Phycisphaerae bacterium]|nr:M48 family metallopeptidase [Phycisphaerae bacterium]